MSDPGDDEAEDVDAAPLLRYSNMQREFYEHQAQISQYDDDIVESVVGSYAEHEQWGDYDRFLMKYVDASFTNKLGLDFGTGPGRNIIRYHHLFQRLDGCDIGQTNLDNAAKMLERREIPVPRLLLTNGRDVGPVEDNTYDFIFSSICMQHICVYEIRYSIFEHMYRALRKLGRISIQMGFGVSPGKVSYFDNFYDADTTNGYCDTMVENPDFIDNDLRQLGFQNFEYWVRPVGPGDHHPFWIFFTATK